jgi:hypothetical protein
MVVFGGNLLKKEHHAYILSVLTQDSLLPIEERMSHKERLAYLKELNATARKKRDIKTYNAGKILKKPKTNYVTDDAAKHIKRKDVVPAPTADQIEDENKNKFLESLKASDGKTEVCVFCGQMYDTMNIGSHFCPASVEEKDPNGE